MLKRYSLCSPHCRIGYSSPEDYFLNYFYFNQDEYAVSRLDDSKISSD